jgi:hypothetical protein
MESIVLIFISIGGALVFSAAGYFFYTRSGRRSAGLYHWKPGEKKTTLFQRMKEEFRQRDRKMNAYKSAIGFTVQGRNLANKVMNEMASLARQRIENYQIRATDLQLLAGMAASLTSLQTEVNKHLFTMANSDPRFIIDDSILLNDRLGDLYITLNLILNASADQQNDGCYLEKLSLESDTLYHEIIRIHEHCMEEFQEYFASQ